jgi:hypothetical protein
METNLERLTFWANKTEDECIDMAIGTEGLDATEALNYLLLRNLAKEVLKQDIKEITDEYSILP